MAHPLDGPRLKIRRAIEQIGALEHAKETFRNSPNYEVVPAELNATKTKQIYRAGEVRTPPLEWGVSIGEIAHNLRSALDNLAWQLALLNTNAPAPTTQFPIFKCGKSKNRRRGQFAIRGRDMIKSLRPEHQTIIEGLQPYKRRRGGRRDPLFLLAELNNSDKHRVIQIVAPRAQSFRFITTGQADDPEIVVSNRRKVLKHGAKVAEAPLYVQVKPHLTTSMSFGKGCVAVQGFPVVATLRAIANEVSKIVEGFAPEFV